MTTTSIADTTSTGSLGGSSSDNTGDVERMACRYEHILAQLAHQAVEQQNEIRSLRAQVAAAATPQSSSSPRSAALEALVARMVRECMTQHTDQLEDELGRRMAHRVRRITARHVQKSIDHAIQRAHVPDTTPPTKPVVDVKSHNSNKSSRSTRHGELPVGSISPLQGCSVRGTPHIPEPTHTLSRHEETLQPCSSPQCVAAALSFVTPTKPTKTHEQASRLSEGSPCVFPDVSPVLADESAELCSLSSSSASSPRAVSRREVCASCDGSVADSEAMEYLLSVFTASEGSVSVNSFHSRASANLSTVTRPAHTRHGNVTRADKARGVLPSSGVDAADRRCASPLPVPRLSKRSALASHENDYSECSVSALNDITREERSLQGSRERVRVSDEVSHLIQILSGSSFA